MDVIDLNKVEESTLETFPMEVERQALLLLVTNTNVQLDKSSEKKTNERTLRFKKENRRKKTRTDCKALPSVSPVGSFPFVG